MLKRTTLTCCAMLFTLGAVTAAPSNAHAQDLKQTGNFGIGLGVGTFASLISAKYFLSPSLSLQGNLGPYRYNWYCNNRRRCGRWGGDSLALSADILAERGPLVGNSDISLGWQIGGGAGVGFYGGGGGADLAVAFVTGLQLNIHALPIDLVLEWRPKVILNGPFFDFWDATGHVRYYF